MSDVSLNVDVTGLSIPIISVAMPVFNGEKYLEQAIDSILNQSFEEFEFIIINDGSTDNSLKILQEYQKSDSRIILVSRENRNLATTLNEIIDLASGKWIARMDQDDIAMPFRFERQLHWLDQTNADICGSWVQRFGTKDNRIVKFHENDELIKAEMLFASPFAHPSVMMKTEYLKKLRYDSEFEKAEDYDLWVRSVQAGCKMTNVPEVLIRYRVHSDQITTRTYSIVQLQAQKIRQKYWKYFFFMHAFK